MQMTRTIGHRWPTSAPRGDYPAECAYCGTVWRRSQLRVDGTGQLVCPQEGPGRDRVTLDRLNAQRARRAWPAPRTSEGTYRKQSPLTAQPPWNALDVEPAIGIAVAFNVPGQTQTVTVDNKCTAAVAFNVPGQTQTVTVFSYYVGFVASDTDTANGLTDVSVSLGTAAAGDTIVLIYGHEDAGDPDTPAGFTVQDTFDAAATVSTPRCTVFTRFVGSSETADYTVSSSDTGRKCLIGYRLINGSSLTKATAATGTSDTPDCPSIAGAAAGDMAIVAVVKDNVSGSFSSDPLGYSEVLSVSGFTDVGNGLKLTAAVKSITAAGSEDPSAHSMDTTEEWGAQTYLIKV